MARHPNDLRLAVPFAGRRRQGVAAWGPLAALAAGVVVGLGAFTFQYAEGLSYFSKDPAACINCHIMQPQFDSWQKAGHHTVATCVDCHLPHAFIPKYMAKAKNGYFHSKGFTFQDFPEPIFIREANSRILHDNCLHCHRNLVADLLPGATGDGRAVSCVHCHRDAGHGDSVGLGRYEPPPPPALPPASEPATPTIDRQP